MATKNDCAVKLSRFNWMFLPEVNGRFYGMDERLSRLSPNIGFSARNLTNKETQAETRRPPGNGS